MQSDIHLPTGFPAGFGQGLDEAMPVHIVEENILPPVSPAHKMIQRPGHIQPVVCAASFLNESCTQPSQPKKRTMYWVDAFIRAVDAAGGP
jgi:hypothetical protein